MTLDLHYEDKMLVAVYDTENSRREDHSFYLRLADRLGVKRVVDLGCGTGVLACALNRDDRKVIAVNPSEAMLAFAKGSVGSEFVEWRLGGAQQLGEPEADLLLMTGNVAQVFIDDSDWADALSCIYQALKPGAYLAFESRNPLAKAWLNWNPRDSARVIETPEGLVHQHSEQAVASSGCVQFESHYLFSSTGETRVVSSTLRFRSCAEICLSLELAGFSLERLLGDWRDGEYKKNSDLMVFIAQKRND